VNGLGVGDAHAHRMLVVPDRSFRAGSPAILLS
jgi:hypothetical protein